MKNHGTHGEVEQLVHGFLSDAESFALWETPSNNLPPDQQLPDLRRRGFQEATHACHILASTLFCCGGRRHEIGFALDGEQFTGARRALLLHPEGRFASTHRSVVGALKKVNLDKEWFSSVSDTEIIELFGVFHNLQLDATWRRQIWSAATLLGRSRLAMTMADGFLFNIMALETLLTNRGERNGHRLACRLFGLLGWHLSQVRPECFEEIQRLHDIRCQIVHDSDYTNLTVRQLLLSDIYATHALLNVVRMSKIVRSKAELQETIDGWTRNGSWPGDDGFELRFLGSFDFDEREESLLIW